MQDKFNRLYSFIVSSRDSKKMQILGEVTKEMMRSLIESHPKMAQELIDKLEAVEWCNYLTVQEANDVYECIQPTPAWNWNKWAALINDNELESEEKPYYNSYALFITMCLIDSTQGKTLREYLKAEDESDGFFHLVYRLAVDQLKDKDGFFNLRDQVNHKKHDTEV